MQVLSLSFDFVLGLPWLKQCGPRPDWSTGKLFWLQKGCWVLLPTVINESAFCAVMESLSGGIVQCGVSEQSNCPFELVLA